MRIIFSTKALNNCGGTERILAVISDALSRNGHQVEIISFVGGGQPPFFRFNENIRIHYLCEGPKPSSKWRQTARRIAAMREIYASFNPDVIIVVDAGRSFVNVPAARGYKMITWEQFNTHINWHLFHHYSRRMAVRASDLIVTLTQKDAAAYRKEFGATKVRCIYNPVTIDYSVPSQLLNRQVLFVGRFTPLKRPDILLKAWALTEGRKKGWKLKMMGFGNAKWDKKLHSMVSEENVSDSVIFEKASPDVGKEMRDSSIFVMTSDREGFGLVLTEAMSMGLPVVSTDCYSGPSEIVDDGKTGYLVPCRDVNAIASRLDKLMEDDDLRRTFSVAGMEKVRQAFSLEGITSEWEDVLKSMN